MLLFLDVISLCVFLFVAYYLCNFPTSLCRLCYWPKNARCQNNLKVTLSVNFMYCVKYLNF